jgi:integral membrane sensor domain MASE1
MDAAAARRTSDARSGAQWRAPSAVRPALCALALSIACFFGSQLDSGLRFPEIDTAILFPPYAFLTVALLLSPTRQWWIYLPAASLGTLVPHLRGWPTSWALETEAANLLRALVAAGGVRYLSGGPLRLDTLRGVGVFLVVAVLLAPALAAFAGAGVVLLHRGGHDFGLLWQAWFLSNALTGVTLLPLLLLSFSRASEETRTASPTQVLEAGLLWAGILGVGLLVFIGPYAGSSQLPARLYAPLPFLLWAAVRLGPRGVSAALLAMAAMAIWGVLRGQGPFSMQPPD